jgi:hypothetical protein
MGDRQGLTRVSLLLVFASGIASGQLTFDRPTNLFTFRDSDFLQTPEICGEPGGTWIAAWSTTKLGAEASSFRIGFTRSADGGLNWSSPSFFDDSPVTVGGGDARPQIETDGRGNWVAVWEHGEMVLPDGNGPDIVVARSSDDGITWSEPSWMHADAPTEPRADRNPKLVSDRQGTWIVVWEVAGEASHPLSNEGDLFISRSTDNGATWSVPQLLNADGMSDAREDVDPDLATDGLSWIACWRYKDDPNDDYDLMYSVSTDRGQSWSAPVALNADAGTDARYDAEPHLAADHSGNWIVVWHALGGVGDDWDIYFSKSSDAVNWTTPLPLNSAFRTDTGDDTAPSIATDGFGFWAVVWESTDDLGGTKGTDWDIVISESHNNGDTWSDARVVDAARSSDNAVDFEHLPVIATNYNGMWRAAWTQGRDISGRGFMENLEVYSAGAFQQPNRSSSDSSGCLIATAAYGTPLAAEVGRLRIFRDSFLLPSQSGAAFTDAYYRLSPTAARWIAQSPTAKSAVRSLLSLALANGMGGKTALTAVSIGILVVVLLLCRRAKKLSFRGQWSCRRSPRRTCDRHERRE